MLVVPEFAYRAAAATIAARAGRTDQTATLLAPLRHVGLARAPPVEHVAERDRQRRRGGRDHRRHRAGRAGVPAARPVHRHARSCRRWRSAASGRSSGPSDWRRPPCGDGDRAVEHLRRAVAANIRLGNRPMTAIARADLADTLADRDAPGDRSEAIAAFRAAAAAAAEIDLGERADGVDASRRYAGQCGSNRGRAAARGWRLDARHRHRARRAARSRRLPGTCTPWWHDPTSRCRPSTCVAVSTSAETGQEVVDPAALHSYRPPRRRARRPARRCPGCRPAPASRATRGRTRRVRDELSTVLARSGLGKAERRRSRARPYGGAQGDRPRPRGDRRLGCGDHRRPAGDDRHRPDVRFLHRPRGPPRRGRLNHPFVFPPFFFFFF